MLAETVCRIFKIEEPVAKGIAIGASSHAVGTVKAMEIGEIEGAMSSLAIAVAGLLTVVSWHRYLQELCSTRSACPICRSLCTRILYLTQDKERNKEVESLCIVRIEWYTPCRRGFTVSPCETVPHNRHGTDTRNPG